MVASGMATLSAHANPAGLTSGCQGSGVVRQVVADHRRDEEVAVVVAGVPAQRQWLPRRRASLLQPLGPQLRDEELVVEALVHEQRWSLRAAGQQLHGVVRGPRGPVLAQVTAERLLAP